MAAISSLYIYAEPRCEAVDFEEIASYAERLLAPRRVILRGPLLEDTIDGNGPGAMQVAAEEIAWKLAGARIRRGDTEPSPGQKVLPGEAAYELRRLSNRQSSIFGILYDGYVFSDVMAGLLPAGESSLGQLHVVFTSQLIGTRDEDDLRYHARAVLLGSPSVVSISGMVEAPAKDRGYYIARRNAEAFGLSEEEKMELARSFAEDCLSHDDIRLTEAAKGYLMQAVAYRMTGEPFCEDDSCRLFNAHWQKELLKAQFGGGREFCDGHSELFYLSSDRGGEAFWT